MCGKTNADGEVRSFCVPEEESCPADCSSDQHVCRLDGSLSGECFPWDTPCSKSCEASEVSCRREATTLTPASVFCRPIEEGCPVACSGSEQRCKDAATGEVSCNPKDVSLLFLLHLFALCDLPDSSLPDSSLSDLCLIHV